MSRIQETIHLDVPVSTAYNQWTQFEDFPHFMEGVESVKQLDDTRLHWIAEFGGTKREWEAKITDQTPDSHIAWEGGPEDPSGAVRFEPLGPNSCRITLVMDYEPQGAREKVGDLLGGAKMRVKRDLARFKQFIESRKVETGAWRGDVSGGQASTGTG
jgi:uncharacterized membrane protein